MAIGEAYRSARVGARWVWAVGGNWRPAIWPLFLIAFGLMCVGLLIGPRVPDKDAGYNCIGNVELPGPFGFGLNCDSPEFMWLARDPSGLLDERNSRQSRPGLVLLAALIQAPLALIVPPDGPPRQVYQGLYDPERVARTFTQDRPAYLAYVLLNFAILLASFHVLWRAIERGRPARDGITATIVVATGLLLVANDVTKAFVWSPHTQMFNILAPVLAVYATQRSLEGAFAERAFALGLGTAVGLGMTAYPVFAVIAACVLPSALLTVLREQSAAMRRRRLANLALFLVLGALPSVLWYALVRATADYIFNAELNLRQVIWMKDVLGQQGFGAFLAQWFEYLRQLLELAAPQAIGLAAFAAWLGLTLLVAAWRRRVPAAAFAAALPAIAVGIYVSIAVLGFYTCVGWVTDRLAYPMIPPLIAAAGTTALVIAQRLRPGRLFAAGCLTIALAQTIYLVFKQGPWS